MDNRISIVINNVVVIGEITHRSRRDIVVEILEPYWGISNCKHIPCFASSLKDYTGEYGVAVAKQLLNQVYTISKEAEELAPKLKALLKKMEELKANNHKIAEENGKHKRLLKIKFKLGEINQTQYQSTLRDMNKTLADSNIKLTEYLDNNILTHFSSTIPFSLRNEVIDLIKDLPKSK